MISEDFSRGQSFLHRIDPRVKIIVALTGATVVATSPQAEILLPAGAFALIMLVKAGLPFRQVLRRLALVNTFVFFLALSLLFSTRGEPFFTLGPLEASRKGLALAGVILVKVNIVLIIMVAFLSTSSVFALVHALHHLHLPSGLVQLLFFTFRYLHVLERELQKMQEAAKLRCFRPRTNLLTYRTYAYLIASLIIRSYERSERVYQAMVCRGFRGTFPVYRHFQLKGQDVGFLAGAILFWGGLLIWTFILR